MKLKELVGYQLISMDREKIVVGKDEKIYEIAITNDYGDCCGYNEIRANLLFEPNSECNPIITDIKKNYLYRNDDDYRQVEITFYGTEKELAKINSFSGSESGYAYGANVCVICNELGIREVITSY